MEKKKLVIFASGEGSNAQQIMDHFRGSALAEVILVVCNKPEANVLNRAKKAGIPTLLLNRSEFFESDTLVKHLQSLGADLLILAGFLWMIPENLVKAFNNRIINIHPSLLPKFGGKGMYGMHVHKAVVAAGEKESGISIHVVNEHYDEGKLLEQHKCLLDAHETPESLAQKIHQLEHAHFPQSIENWLLNCRQ